MPQSTYDDKVILDLIMAWRSKATSDYLSQCWPWDLYQHMASIGHNELMQKGNNPEWIDIFSLHFTHTDMYYVSVISSFDWSDLPKFPLTTEAEWRICVSKLGQH